MTEKNGNDMHMKVLFPHQMQMLFRINSSSVREIFMEFFFIHAFFENNSIPFNWGWNVGGRHAFEKAKRKTIEFF